MHKGERDWGIREVERRARQGNYSLSNGTVSNILNCRQKNVTRETLEALAYVFGVPPSEVFAVYHGTAGEDENLIRNQRLAALAVDAEKLTPDNLPKFEALMDYVQTTVRQMVKEQSDALPRSKGKTAKSRVG